MGTVNITIYGYNPLDSVLIHYNMLWYLSRCRGVVRVLTEQFGRGGTFLSPWRHILYPGLEAA